VRIGYFPGCSLHAMGREFDESLVALAPRLGIELAELEDWSCCGSTSAHATNHLLSIALPARALAQAEEQGHEELLAPCAACFSRLAVARHELGADAALLTRVRGVLERPGFGNAVRVRHAVDVLFDVIPAIQEQAHGSLAGLKVACYYGCLLVRPPFVAGRDDSEQPRSMEAVAAATGAEPVAWNRRLDCCGGGMALARTSTVVRLGREILADAAAAGAQAVVVACPMCHSNLDMRQQAMQRESALPIVYVTELVGLALGLPAKALGLFRHFVDPTSVARHRPALPAAAGGST